MYEGLSGQKKGLLFFAAVVIVFMQGGLWAARRHSLDNFPDNDLLPSSRYLPFGRSNHDRPNIKEHPVPKLMADAETRYREKLSRQSKTLEDAVKEYERRYGRKPPRGFDDWWRFARSNSVLMIDEYDNIDEDLAPFWEITAEQLRWRASIVSDTVIHATNVTLLTLPGGIPSVRRRGSRKGWSRTRVQYFGGRRE